MAERAAAALLWQHPSADELLAAARETGEVTAFGSRWASSPPKWNGCGCPKPSERPTGRPPARGRGAVDADDATSQRLDRLQQRLRAQGVALREARDE